jgi:hypothetical protein
VSQQPNKSIEGGSYFNDEEKWVVISSYLLETTYLNQECRGGFYERI